MRVIAGSLRSRPLLAPLGQSIRPTADRLRETLFNVLTNGAIDRIAGKAFLDLYAGSGAVGIEALSRGAGRVTFVEESVPALAILKKNLESLGLKAGFTLQRRSAGTFLPKETSQFDVVFLDPPYEAADEYALTLGLLGGECRDLLAKGALVVAEHRRKDRLAEQYGELVRTRVLEQGDTGLSFYAVQPVEQSEILAAIQV